MRYGLLILGQLYILYLPLLSLSSTESGYIDKMNVEFCNSGMGIQF